MIFSALDVIGKEQSILENRKGLKGAGVWERITNSFFCPRNPKHTFAFFVPEYLFIRSVSFCEDISEEMEGKFETKDLAQILYEDFLEHFKKKNDLHEVYKKLTVRDLSPSIIKPYQTEEAYGGVLFEEQRGFQEVKVTLSHQQALKGEFILRDMLDIYSEHQFTLENILEITYSNFIDDYRKGLIKNPIDKVIQYI
ncbi:hypothetical protein [Niallia sp. NCCP-28]|uniref:hypothetical protein n=1 Tax=Niallia sp. NCCP-28 TaxID=2934712 RepID=UPI00208CAFBB|nr:hypothetical protein [Niallia sp. NCCP-28]GKU82586.1 hypothetical protein NCCP28_19820 [Niallia sp. NCCP-28]